MSDDRDISTVKTPAAELRILEDVSPDGEGDDVEENVGRFVWPTAVPLLRHIIDDSDSSSSSSSSSSLDIQNCRLIVELGAGCGVLGMGLAAAAAAERTAAAVGTGKDLLEANRDDGSPPKDDLHIILTDHDEDWLRRNVALNEPLLRETTSATLEATRLDWRDLNDIAAVQVAVLERLTNGSDGNGNGELLIVASDVLYNHGAHGDLARTLYELSKSQRTRIVMGFPDRDWDEEHFRPFATELFGEEFPRSEPIDPRHHKRGRMTDLRVIDFCVDSKKLSPGI